MKKKIQRGANLFERFTGRAARYQRIAYFPENPGVALDIGKCLGIMYETVRDGKRERYLHEFAPGSRPLLAVSFDGKQLFLLGGAYNFTARGIVDKRRVNRKG